MIFCSETVGQSHSSLGEKIDDRQTAAPTAVGRKAMEERKKENQTIRFVSCCGEERVRGPRHQKSEKAQSVQESKQDSRGGKRNQTMKKRKLFVPE